MSNLRVISKSDHANSYWKKPDSFLFADTLALVPIVAQELYNATMSLTTAFTKADDAYTLVAVLGLKENSNAYVSKEGAWLGKYIPAAIRAFPFSIANSDDDTQVLCINEDYILAEETDMSAPFFDDEGNPAQKVQDAFSFLNQLNQSIKATKNISDLLRKHDLFEAWPLKIDIDSIPTKIEGLYRISEEKLTALDAEAYPELMSSGAMLVAYSHLLSMQHVDEIQSFLLSRYTASDEQMPEELDFDFFNDSESINFNNF